MLLLSSADFFSKIIYSKNSFRNTIRENGLDPGWDRCCVGPDLSQNFFQRLSADDKLPLARKELIYKIQGMECSGSVVECLT